MRMRVIKMMAVLWELLCKPGSNYWSVNYEVIVSQSVDGLVFSGNAKFLAGVC